MPCAANRVRGESPRTACSALTRAAFCLRPALPAPICRSKKPTGSRVKLSVLRRPPAQPGAPGAHAAVGPGQGSLERAVIEVVLAPLSCLLPTLLSVDYHPGWVIIGGLVFLRTGQPLLDQIVNKRATGSFTHVQSLMSLFDKDGVASGVEEVVILQVRAKCTRAPPRDAATRTHAPADERNGATA
jgi:hypothetical protein